MHSTRSRRPLRVILAVVLVVALLFTVAWLYARTSLPQTNGTLQVNGLDGAVEIVRDRAGVPHIFAGTDHDAVFSLGYLHAQDRMWQMEMSRRTGAGRLSEVLGEAALPIDKFLRTLGTYRAAAVAWPALEPRTQSMIEAYVAGVNAWLDEGHTLPPEYWILGFTPEAWTPIDSIVWSKMMAWDMGSDYDTELMRAALTQAIGPERTAELLPPYPAEGIEVLATTLLAPDGVVALLTADSILQQGLKLSGLFGGSNNWVVSGEHTASGLPLLADDPHLGTPIPSTWYLVEMHGDSLHISGASLPSLPLIVIGHNERIAWGLTNVNPDVQDLYIERINPADPNQYEVEGEWVDMEIVEELIYVKGEDEPLHWAARSTRHGPLIGDASEAPMPVALRWTALDAGDTTIDAFARINYASGWEEFHEAMRSFVAPSQNFVYADVDGNIGYIAPGHIPMRAQGNGMVPVPGWNSEYEWEGWIPFDELPQIFNPPSGFIVTANNRIISDGYPYLIANDWHPPYRAQRIADLLREKIDRGAKLTLDDMAAIQGDQLSLQASALLPFLLETPVEDERQAEAIAYLREWDGDSGRDSIASTIYHAWFLHLGYAMFEDELDEGLYTQVSRRSHPLFLQELLGDPERFAGWCDNILTMPRESCAETAAIALDNALEDVGARLGNNMARWQWGRLHKTQYAHTPFSQVALLRPFFHRSIENGGDAYTVNVATLDMANVYDQDLAPSYRQIVDLGDWSSSFYIQTTGQSGNPLSPHYDDLITPHRDMEYLPMTFGREAVEGDVLRLEPLD
jgi:penicillin amidase